MNEESTKIKSGLFSLLEELAGTRPIFPSRKFVRRLTGHRWPPSQVFSVHI